MTTRTDLNTIIEMAERIRNSLEQEPPAPKRAEVVPVIPCSWPNSEFSEGVTHYENTLAGLRNWKGSAVVLTQKGGPELYQRLAQDVPSLKIIPGLISHSQMQTLFDNPHGWVRFIDDAKAIIKATGCDTFMLDFEESLRAYVYGKVELDVTIPSAFLSLLPKDVTYLVYPAPYWFADFPRGIHRLEALCRVIERRLNVRWIAQDFARPDLVGTDETVYARSTLLGFARDPIDQLVWFYDKPDNWKTDEVGKVAEMAYAKDPKSVLYAYPGHKDWAEQSPLLVEALGAKR